MQQDLLIMVGDQFQYGTTWFTVVTIQKRLIHVLNHKTNQIEILSINDEIFGGF